MWICFGGRGALRGGGSYQAVHNYIPLAIDQHRSKSTEKENCGCNVLIRLHIM